MPVTRIEVGAVNIAASPHPDGVYRRLLEAVADKEIWVWGSDKAKITSPGPFEDNSNWLYGQILVWAEIDTRGKWLNKRKNKEATAEEKQQVADALPADLEPNFRAFNYIFIVNKHRLVLEYRNELGQHFGAKRALLFFSRLFSSKNLPPDSPSVEVTTIPSDESLDNIFSITRLRKLEIYVKRPNADDLTDDAGRILGRLERQGARSQKIELAKAPKVHSLMPDESTKELARIASENGYVSGEGKDAAGKMVYESTEQHPKSVSLEVHGTSSFATFLSSLRFF